jgi:hypothetical protein
MQSVQLNTDVVLGVAIPLRNARGRIGRLGPVLDAVLANHGYPPAIDCGCHGGRRYHELAAEPSGCSLVAAFDPLQTLGRRLLSPGWTMSRDSTTDCSNGLLIAAILCCLNSVTNTHRPSLYPLGYGRHKESSLR